MAQWDIEQDDYETVYVSRKDSSHYVIVGTRSGSITRYYNDWAREVYDDLNLALADLVSA